MALTPRFIQREGFSFAIAIELAFTPYTLEQMSIREMRSVWGVSLWPGGH